MFHIFSLVSFLIMESRVGPDMTEVRVLCIPLKINDGGGSTRPTKSCLPGLALVGPDMTEVRV